MSTTNHDRRGFPLEQLVGRHGSLQNAMFRSCIVAKAAKRGVCEKRAAEAVKKRLLAMCAALPPNAGLNRRSEAESELKPLLGEGGGE